MSDELRMTVSGVVPKDGRKNVYVVFEDGVRRAEDCVPDCEILSSQGFEEEELEMLKLYMKQQQDQIREMAKNINPIKALMK